MAITTLAHVTGDFPGQTIHIAKTSGGSNTGVPFGAWVSGIPPTGAAPTLLNGHLLTSATTGALPLVDAPGGENTYISRFVGSLGPTLTTTAPGSGIIFVYDRLWHNLVNITAVGNQAISMSALTRFTTGDAVEAWWEVYVATGAATPTVTLSYTDQSGAAETTGSSGVMVSALSANRTGPFQLASGDTGVRAITGWSASASFISGQIGVVLRRKLAAIPVPGGPVTLSASKIGLMEVPDAACLEIVYVQSLPASMMPLGTLHAVHG
jgi:hypothetical protein